MGSVDTPNGELGAPRAGAWDRFARVSTALSIAAIPVGLAFGGWVIQKELQSQSLRKEYVALAVSILQQPDTDRVGPELRGWAVDLLNLNSDVKFSDEATKHLKSGEARLPSDFYGKDLAPDVGQRLVKFQAYLIEVGFEVKPGRVGYTLFSGDSIKIDGHLYSALYDGRENTMKVARKYADAPDVALHEYMRRVLEQSSAAPSNTSLAYSALNSGLSVYFPCSSDGHSTFAAATDLALDLRGARRLDGPLPRDAVSSFELGSAAWGAVFWTLRERIPEDKAVDKLLARTWSTWRPPGREQEMFKSFGQALLSADPTHAAIIRGVLEERGLKLPAP